MADISLTLGMRSNLVSLQQTAKLMTRTQDRLSSGKKVMTALDDPSKYFAAQNHMNRASDLEARKSDMGEAVQAMKAADKGITGITALIEQAKGLTQSARAANAADRASLAGRFDEIRAQITTMAADSGYKGKNFLKGDSLKVSFNETGTSSLTVVGFDASATGLAITESAYGTADATNVTAATVGTNVTTGTTYALTLGEATAGAITITKHVDTTAAAETNAAWTGTQAVTLANAGTASSIVITAGTSGTLTEGVDYTVTFAGDHGSAAVITFNVGDATAAAASINYHYMKDTVLTAGSSYTVDAGTLTTAGSVTFLTAATGTVTIDYSVYTPGKWATDTAIDADVESLNKAISTLRTQSASLSASLGIITARQDFAQGMIDTLTQGADGLTLADMNEEGANMLMLQTRQQLGTTALSLSAQAAQSILRLF